MSKGRALLTDREREAIAGETSDNYRYKTRTYVRDRVERLREDVGLLAEHEPDLLAELQAVVCEEPPREAREARAAGAERDPAATPDRSPSPADDGGHDADADALEGVEFPGGVDRADGVAAVLAARDHIRAEGSASMKEIVAAVMPDHPTKYDAEADLERLEDPDRRNRSTWWRKVVKPGLGALPTVQPPAQGESDWRHVGER